LNYFDFFEVMCNDILLWCHLMTCTGKYWPRAIKSWSYSSTCNIFWSNSSTCNIFWSYSSTCNIFWFCYCFFFGPIPVPVIFFGLFGPPHFFWSYSSTIFGLITVLIFGPRTVLRFWSYYGDPVIHVHRGLQLGREGASQPPPMIPQNGDPHPHFFGGN
jgi:hypothetical protein